MVDSGFHDVFRAKWQELNKEIEKLHQQRKKEGIEEATKDGIRLFLEFLYWCNDKSPCLNETNSFAELEMKPVNMKERLEFILERPGLFPAYRQLCELMAEQEKLLAKKMVMTKASSQND